MFDVYVECGCGSGQQIDGSAHALAVTAPNAERCCRTKFRKVSGGRPLAAARAEGSVSLRKIAVLSSHIAARMVMCWIMAWLGRPPNGACSWRLQSFAAMCS